jgi:hypothetical protein
VDAINQYDAHSGSGGTTSGKSGKIASFFSVFGYHPKKPQPVKMDSVDEQKLKSIRDRLLIEYNDNLTFKTNSLNEFCERAPLKPVKYRQAWNDIKARIVHDQLEFNRCQTKEVMLQCVRLYVTVLRSFHLIYGENPLAAVKRPLNAQHNSMTKISDEDEKTVGKAKELFKQMIVGMNNQLYHYYCLQPNRCDFTQYLDNFNRIADASIRDAILAGDKDDDLLAQLFTEFETPLEAFQLSASKP